MFSNQSPWFSLIERCIIQTKYEKRLYKQLLNFKQSRAGKFQMFR